MSQNVYHYAYDIATWGRPKIVALEILCERVVNDVQISDAQSGLLQHYAGRVVRKEKQIRLELLIQIQLVLVFIVYFLGF